MLGLSLAMGVAAAPEFAAQGHGSCSSCHHPPEADAITAGSDGEKSDVPTPQGTAIRVVPCESCHVSLAGTGTPQDPGPGMSSTWHAERGCLTCHDPHETGTPFRLRRVPNPPDASMASRLDAASRLCSSCHSSMLQVQGFGGYVRHPLGVPWPRREERVVTTAASTMGWQGAQSQIVLPLARLQTATGPTEYVIGCTTCHFPHGSANSFSLRWAADQEGDGCGACHRSVVDPDRTDAVAGDP